MACSCGNNAIGIWVCDGTGNCVVLTPPTTGGPWFPIRDNGTGTWSWYNLGDLVDTPVEGFRAAKPKTKPKAKKSTT